MKKDVITFGAGSLDVYLISKGFSGLSGKKIEADKKIRLKIDSKAKLEKIFSRTGGGGTNAAATFKKQGFDVAWCGMLGKDSSGDQTMKELKKRKVDVSLVSRTNKKPTNLSMILTSLGKERTILVFRGASGELARKDVPWGKLKAKWFYIAPMSGRSALLTEELIDFARKNGIKVAANMGSSQFSLPKGSLKRIFKKIDILILNRQEASLLTGINFNKEKQVFKKLDKMVEGVCIMTKGREGVTVSDGNYLYLAPALNVKFVDSTGAGDSFGSGFVSGMIRDDNIASAIQLGMANSASCLKKWGAKEGLLGKKQSFKKVKIKKIKL